MLRWIAFGPKDDAMSYKGYIINEQRFHIKDVGRETQNCGVTFDVTTICRASAKDMSQVVDVVTYYGILTDIILLDYHLFYIPVFKCRWTYKGNGVKVDDDGFTLVNLHQASFSRDPYILASQAKQVFYSRENNVFNWYVVMKAPSRSFNDIEEHDCIEEDIQVVEDEITEADDEDVSYVREDCEGILE